MSNSLKGLLLAAGVIITCIVVSLGFYISREANAAATNGVSQISRMNKEIAESDKSMYDGLDVTGSEVMNAINKVLGRKSEVIKNMEKLLEQTVSTDYDEQLEDIDVRMKELQLKLG